MLDFVKSAFRRFFDVILWINLGLYTMAGGIIENVLMGRRAGSDVPQPFIGIFIGCLAGLLMDIICGGFIATILNIDKNLEELKNN